MLPYTAGTCPLLNQKPSLFKNADKGNPLADCHGKHPDIMAFLLEKGILPVSGQSVQPHLKCYRFFTDSATILTFLRPAPRPYLLNADCRIQRRRRTRHICYSVPHICLTGNGKNRLCPFACHRIAQSKHQQRYNR